MADVNTGSNAILRVNAWLAGGSDAGNYSDVGWELWLIERTAGTFGYNGGNPPIPANVSVNGGQVWSGGFGFDFRPGGQQSVLIAAGSTRVWHNADGSSPGCTVTGYMGATGTSTAGGPASVAQGVDLPTRKVTPGTPTGVTATRVSDSQISLSWSQSSASNGQPVSNQVYRSINGGPYEKILDVAATNSLTVAASANQKLRYRVQAWNAAGFSGLSAESAPVYTTPGAPSGVGAFKDTSLNIDVSFTENVDYAEYEHEVWHGTVAGGVTTWDGAPAVTLATGVLSWEHVAPNPAQVHKYRVRAKAGTLLSTYAESPAVQLLAAPNAPGLAELAPYSDKAAVLQIPWTHNPVDSTAQTAYEVEYSTNGGSSWSSTGKVASTVQSRTFPASTWAADVTVQFRVRTWGQANTGGSDGTGASPWSAVRSTTFKTRPSASIVSPANSSVVTQSTVTVVLGFSQLEGATFVDATITLLEGGNPLEVLPTSNLAGTLLATRVQNGGTYTVEAVVRDSNGLSSTAASSTFTVDYLDPVPAQVVTTYLEDSGFVQLGLVIPAPSGSEAAAVLVKIERTINGSTETVLEPYPVSTPMTILDTTPTVNGTNAYVVTTISADGSELGVPVDVVTAEGKRAFLSKGPGFAEVVSFGYSMRLQADPRVDQRLVKAAGRSRPIGLYGTAGDLVVSGSALLYPDGGLGSTPDAIERLLLMPGRACYRDPSGRRVFGQVEGSVSRDNAAISGLTFSIAETS